MPKSPKKPAKPTGRWLADVPYNQLPPLPPVAELETRAVLKGCISARAALAELKQAAQLIPNQGVLINALPLLEARASSEIENVVTTTDRLFQHQGCDDHADPATKEALRYSRALLEGYQSLTREQAWEACLLFIVDGVDETARWTGAKIDAIRRLAEHTSEYVRKRLPKIYSCELINLIFELPYCRIQNVVDVKIVGRQVASRYLKQLVELGVLEEKTVGCEKLFIHPKLLRLLTHDRNHLAQYE